jgi:uncharacterized protein involved in exopolysaccharide biosynthesis
MGSLGGLGGSLGGLAAFAGVSLGKGQNWTEAIAILRSRHLVEQLVTTRDLKPELFAQRRGWSPRDLFARRAGGAGGSPTMGDAVKLFKTSILQVKDDAKTGLVTVSVQWYDRNAAAEWANALVELADAELRATAIKTADAALTTLRQEFARTQEVEMRLAISRLMEAQLKAKLAATIRPDFAFRIIDVAVPADVDKRVQPTRTVMVLAGTLFGVLAGLMLVAIRAERARARG